LTTYWAYRCQEKNCAMTNESSCLVSIDEMPVPEKFEGMCWIASDSGPNDRVIWKLEEIQD